MTVATTEGSARRTMNHAFLLGLAFLGTTVVVVPLAILGYQMARRRMKAGTESGSLIAR